MKYFILLSLLILQNSAFARPAAEQCFQELTCAGRVHRFDNQVASQSDQNLFVAYFAVDYGRVPPLSELQTKYGVRLKDFEAMCNRERYRRSSFGPDSWNQDSRLNWMKSDMKCWPLLEAGGACRTAGQACQTDSECCSRRGFQSCDLTLGVCKNPPLLPVEVQ